MLISQPRVKTGFVRGCHICYLLQTAFKDCKFTMFIMKLNQHLQEIVLHHKHVWDTCTSLPALLQVYDSIFEQVCQLNSHSKANNKRACIHVNQTVKQRNWLQSHNFNNAKICFYQLLKLVTTIYYQHHHQSTITICIAIISFITVIISP